MPLAKPMEAKIDKWDDIKFTCFYTTNEMRRIAKDSPQTGRKYMPTTHTIFMIYKALVKLNNNKKEKSTPYRYGEKQ